MRKPSGREAIVYLRRSPCRLAALRGGGVPDAGESGLRRRRLSRLRELTEFGFPSLINGPNPVLVLNLGIFFRHYTVFSLFPGGIGQGLKDNKG